MLIIKATWFATIGVLLSLFVVGAAWALPPRVSWEPARIAPPSIAPGESATFSVTLKHTGILPIPATPQLRIVPEGALAHYVTVIPPAFPPVLKRGDRVSVQVTVTVPANTPLSVLKGELLLERILPNGKVKEVFRAEALPVELTFSSIALPPDPGEAGKATLEGIDSNGNGVRDDVERQIALKSEGSQLLFLALMQGGRAMQQVILAGVSAPLPDGEVDSLERGRDMARRCLMYVMKDLEWVGMDRWISSIPLDTKDRSDAYLRYDALFSGQVIGDSPGLPAMSSKQNCQGFDPDTLGR